MPRPHIVNALKRVQVAPRSNGQMPPPGLYFLSTWTAADWRAYTPVLPTHWWGTARDLTNLFDEFGCYNSTSGRALLTPEHDDAVTTLTWIYNTVYAASRLRQTWNLSTPNPNILRDNSITINIVEAR